MINFIHFSFVPNTASTNRLLAYMCNIPKDINVRLFFIMPDDLYSRWNQVPDNVEVIYCWDIFKIKWKFLKIFLFYFALFYIRILLRRGDVVYCYNTPLYMNIFRKKGIKLYGEKTEHPEVTSSESRLIKYSLKKHLLLCRNLDGLFVISSSLKNYYINQGVDKNKIHIINMIVETSRFSNLIKENNNVKYLAYCGTMSNTKDGVDKLIRSFKYVNDKYPEILLYIIGKASSDKENNENYKLALSLNIVDKIVFTGKVPANDIPQLLKNAEALVLNRPDSLQSQCGFPTKLGEYLLTGNPVIVTKVGDIPLFLENHISAILSSPYDDEEFGNKILWVIEHPEESSKIGLNGKKVALKFFNAQTETKKLLKYMHS